MVSKHKKQYMKKYNKLPNVKARKAAYMRKKRSEHDKQAAIELVNFLLDIGYEDMAYEYALERAPQMLLTLKASRSAKTAEREAQA